jgi:thioredoxin-like negative regulator of GroEL
MMISPAVAALLFSLSATLPSVPAPGAGIAWERKFDAALARARAEQKPVLVDFWAEWCEWCHELDRTTYVDAQVVEAAKAFVAVKVNTEGDGSEIKLTEKYDIQTLPTIGVVSPEGRVIYIGAGFQKAEKLLDTLAAARRAAGEILPLEKSLAANPKDPAAMVALGTKLFETGALADSRELLTKARGADASRPVKERKQTRILLASIRSREKKHGDAEKLLKEAIALTPAEPHEDAAAWATLGGVYAAWGKKDPARAALQKAIELEPEGAVATKAKASLAELK